MCGYYGQPPCTLGRRGGGTGWSIPYSNQLPPRAQGLPTDSFTDRPGPGASAALLRAAKGVAAVFGAENALRGRLHTRDPVVILLMGGGGTLNNAFPSSFWVRIFISGLNAPSSPGVPPTLDTQQ